jgi:hypothetical protein
MGGDLSSASDGAAPVFLVHAMKEADGANLDRVQIIKGWIDANGEERHQIYNVALSDDREPGGDGTIPAVGDTVSVEDATYTNSIGDAQLSVAWTDPDFDPSLPAVSSNPSSARPASSSTSQLPITLGREAPTRTSMACYDNTCRSGPAKQRSRNVTAIGLHISSTHVRAGGSDR